MSLYVFSKAHWANDSTLVALHGIKAARSLAEGIAAAKVLIDMPVFNSSDRAAVNAFCAAFYAKVFAKRV